MNFFQLIYCRLYEFCRDENKAFEFTAVCVFSILLSFNTLTLYFLLRYIFHYEVHAPLSSLYLGLVAIFYMIILSLAFIRNKKYISLYEQFEVDNKRKKASIITIVYAIFSIGSLISMIWLD